MDTWTGEEVDDSLPIDSGDILEIEVIEGSEWWWGKNQDSNMEGWVPSNFVQLPE